MTLSRQIIVLYLEAQLVLGNPVSQVAMAKYVGVGRHNMGQHFDYWKQISSLPFYDKSEKVWVKAKRSQSVLFRSKPAAEKYIEQFEGVFLKAKKLRIRQKKSGK